MEKSPREVFSPYNPAIVAGYVSEPSTLLRLQQRYPMMTLLASAATVSGISEE